MSQKRQVHRHPMRIPLTIQTIARTGEQHLIEAVYTKDVSLGGLAFTSEQAWLVGSVLHINISAEPPFTFIGKVVWCQPLCSQSTTSPMRYDIGVEFMAKKASMLDELVRIENYYKLS